jgi:hypothetical protein
LKHRLRVPALLAVACATAACAPAHLNPVALSGAREFPELLLGGWDGRRLGLFDDTAIEPGVTSRAQLVQALGRLAPGAYGAIYVQRARLDAALAEKHGLFCDAALCLAVLDRKDRGADFAEWGRAVAVFELAGADSSLVGPVWLAGRAVRSPGPGRWPLLCRGRTDSPRRVHPDGGALYPERVVGAEEFVLFGPTELPAQYLERGTPAPSETLCDDEAVRLRSEPAPERPVIRADPRLLGIGQP